MEQLTIVVRLARMFESWLVWYGVMRYDVMHSEVIHPRRMYPAVHARNSAIHNICGVHNTKNLRSSSYSTSDNTKSMYLPQFTCGLGDDIRSQLEGDAAHVLPSRFDLEENLKPNTQEI